MSQALSIEPTFSVWSNWKEHARRTGGGGISKFIIKFHKTLGGKKILRLRLEVKHETVEAMWAKNTWRENDLYFSIPTNNANQRYHPLPFKNRNTNCNPQDTLESATKIKCTHKASGIPFFLIQSRWILLHHISDICRLRVKTHIKRSGAARSGAASSLWFNSREKKPSICFHELNHKLCVFALSRIILQTKNVLRVLLFLHRQDFSQWWVNNASSVE
jgi:hypothetical protein